jgi:hypothetical protein
VPTAASTSPTANGPSEGIVKHQLPVRCSTISSIVSGCAKREYVSIHRTRLSRYLGNRQVRIRSGKKYNIFESVIGQGLLGRLRV